MVRQSTVLKPTKQKRFKRPLFGFDIETYDNNTKISMISIYGKNYKNTFLSVEDFKNDLKTNRVYTNCYIVATNLSFDFFGSFWNSKEINNFTTIPKGNTSSIITAKTFIKDNEFVKSLPLDQSGKKGHSITFIDTFNYHETSVEKLGKLVGYDKLIQPECITLQCAPRSDTEWNELKEYNMRDSEISYKFILFLIEFIESLGGTFRITNASCAMSLFTNKYLSKPIFRQPVEELLELFEGYVGGRTEVFGRGSLRSLMRKYNVNRLYYVDINSLYPSVMRDFTFPDPNSRRIARQNTLQYIIEFEGMSRVDIVSPEHMNVPFLHLKRQMNIIFPLGSFHGWYTHVELRKALELGYTINKVYKSYYYLETIQPFKQYVDDLYKKRQEFKQQGNKICELIVKLLMNGLYGKFGQRFYDKEKTVPIPDSIEELELMKSFTIIEQGDMKFMRLTHMTIDPSPFCIPIWASYITGYARIRLYHYLQSYRIVYCDTDSAISLDPIHTSKNLGEMKFEGEIEDGFIIRSKFYGMKGMNADGKPFDEVKIKGVSLRAVLQLHDMKRKNQEWNIEELKEYLFNPEPLIYKKLIKWKEALRKDLFINSSMDVRKELSLEDEKHIWDKPFSYTDWQEAKPITVKNEIAYSKHREVPI